MIDKEKQIVADLKNLEEYIDKEFYKIATTIKLKSKVHQKYFLDKLNKLN